MNGKIKILIVALVVVLVAFIAVVALGNHEQKDLDDECIKTIEFYDGHLNFNEKKGLADMTVVFGYDMDKVHYQKPILTGGPSVEVFYQGQYIGTMKAQDNNISLTVDGVSRAYHLYYDLESIGLCHLDSIYFEWNGQTVSTSDMTLKANHDVPQSWKKWMLDDCVVKNVEMV